MTTPGPGPPPSGVFLGTPPPHHFPRPGGLQALEALRKLRQDKAQEVKIMKAKLETLKTHKVGTAPGAQPPGCRPQGACAS
jgi:hypothetical protein